MAIVKQEDAKEEFLRHKGLVSQMTPLSSVDPLSFFAAGAEKYKGKRFYWAEPAQEKVFVGLGTTCEIEVYEEHGEDRFKQVEAEWERLRQLCRTESRRCDLRRTGSPPSPLLFGGFSFDPLATQTPLWRSYSDAVFTVPTFLLTVTQDGTWLTVNRTSDVGEHQLKAEWEGLVRRAQETDIAASVGTVSYTASDVAPETWKEAVREVVRQIRAGAVDKVTLAREVRLHLEQPASIAEALWRLCQKQPESYVFAFERGDACFFGASPERLVKREGDKLYSTSLASSIARGDTPEEDVRLGETLLRDQKLLHEHRIVVNMIKEAMESGCDEVNVPPEPTLFKAPYIQHLYTPVTGTIREGTSLWSMVKKLHPTPALGGYPQKTAVAKIRRLEQLDRGWYAAPLGWIDQNGDGEFIGAIRSGIARGKNVSLFVGNGIVGESDAEKEFTETKLKQRPVLSALGGEAR